MRSKLIFVSLLAVVGWAAFAAGFSAGQDKKANSRVYELRTYTTLPGRLPALNKRFAEHTMKIFERHGIQNEAYWVPLEEDNKLIYVVSHESREAADVNWKAFGADAEWQQARTASEADGKILAKAPERVWMKATEYSPGK
jgi:hypothetical protein